MKPDKKKKGRKKINEPLQDSESLFRNQFKLSNIGMAITSVEREWIHINPRLCKMLGYTEEELRLKKWTEISHPEDLKENFLQFNKMLSGEIEAYELENRFFRKDGTIIIIHITVSCFRNPDRSVRYVINSFYDITEKKRDEENMRHRNEKLSALNRLARTVAGQSSLKEVCDTATREVTSVMKTDMSVIFVREGKELHLKSAGPVRMWKERNSVDVHIVGECLCGLAAENGQAIYCRNIHEDERCTWVECRNAGFRSFTALPLCYGNDTIGVLGIASIQEYNFEEKSTFLETVASQLAVSIYNARLLEETRNYAARLEEEITVRKQAVDALMESRHQLYDIAANSPGIIFQFFYRSDSSMGLYYVSDRGAEITGLDNNPDDFFERFTAGILEEDRQNFLDSIKKAIETVSNWRFEGRFRKTSGELMWFNAQSTPQYRGNELLFNGIFMDITEQKKTEEELKLNEARLEALEELNNMPDISFEYMAHFTMDAAIRLTKSRLGYVGFSSEDETVITMYAWSKETMKECMVEEKILDFPVEKAGIWAEAVRQRKPVITNDYGAPNPLKKGYPPGHVHIVRHMSVPLLDRGRVVVVIGVGNKNEDYDQSDVRQLTLLMSGMWRILKRKQAEDELSRTQALLKAAIEQTPAGIVIANAPDGRIRMINNAGLSIRGRTSSTLTDIPLELHQKNWQIFWPDGTPGTPEDLPLSVAILKGKTCSNVEMIMRRSDGEDRWILVNAAPVRNDRGEVIAGVVVFTDITERKKAEEALIENEKKFRSIFEFAPCGIAISDPEGRYLNVNDNFCRMHGLNREKIIGHIVFEVSEMYQPENREQVLSIIKKLEEKGSIQNEEIKLIRPSDRKRAIILYSAANISISGEPCIISMTVDITEWKNLGEQLLHAQKMEAIGQLAGGVAHDFNNILLAILGYTGMVMKDMSPYDPRRSDLEQAHRAAEKAASLTKQLLAYSRRQVLKLTLININKVIEELIKMLRRLIGENIDLKVIPTEDLYTVNADRSQVEQIVINLCVNARDAMPDGGSLVIETENVTVDSIYCSVNDWARPGRYVKLSITDSGHGMDEDTRKQIFEPFFTTKKDGKGTGLGLSMVYGIIRQHRGMIHVYSEPAKGSRFSIYMPAGEGVELPDEGKTVEPVRGGHETILLAEDDNQIRFLTRRILEEAGYHVLTASSGEEAISLYRKYAGEINLLFLDIIMPGKGGQVVYKKIRSLNPGIKCLFTSGYSDTAVHTNFILNKDFSLIQKPYKNEQLLVTVRQILDREEKSCTTEEISSETNTIYPGNTGKILIVDDEESIRDICLFHIEDMGFHGLSASGGEEAVKIFRKHAEEILCVVIDLQMPNMKGTETFREIKSIRPDIPVIFSSGYGLEEEIDSLIAGGLVEFLYKPYNPREFKDKITEAIDRFRAIP